MSDIYSAIAFVPDSLSVAGIVEKINSIRGDLRSDSTLWVRITDVNSPMNGRAWRAVLDLQRSGWILRSEIIPNTEQYEYIFMFGNSRFYYYDVDAVRIPYAPISPDKYKKPRGSSKYVSTDIYADGHSQELNDKRLRYMHPLGQNRRNFWNGDTISPMILASAPIDGKILNVYSNEELSRLIAIHNRIEVK